MPLSSPSFFSSLQFPIPSHLSSTPCLSSASSLFLQFKSPLHLFCPHVFENPFQSFLCHCPTPKTRLAPCHLFHSPCSLPSVSVTPIIFQAFLFSRPTFSAFVHLSLNLAVLSNLLSDTPTYPFCPQPSASRRPLPCPFCPLAHSFALLHTSLTHLSSWSTTHVHVRKKRKQKSYL